MPFFHSANVTNHAVAASDLTIGKREPRNSRAFGLLCAFLKLSDLYTRRSHLTNRIE